MRTTRTSARAFRYTGPYGWLSAIDAMHRRDQEAMSQTALGAAYERSNHDPGDEDGAKR